MQIKIDLKIFLMALLFFLTRQLELYILFMVFALIHELGHLITGIIFGFKPKKIELLPVGVCANFYINLDNYNQKKNNANLLVVKKMIITIAGPVINFVLAVMFYIFKIRIGSISTEALVYANIIICAFNLLPIYPLDGGRIIKYIIHIIKGLKSSYKYTHQISNATVIILTMISSLACLWLKNVSIIMILTYLWVLVIVQNKKYNSKMKVYRLIEKI